MTQRRWPSPQTKLCLSWEPDTEGVPRFLSEVVVVCFSSSRSSGRLCVLSFVAFYTAVVVVCYLFHFFLLLSLLLAVAFSSVLVRSQCQQAVCTRPGSRWRDCLLFQRPPFQNKIKGKRGQRCEGANVQNGKGGFYRDDCCFFWLQFVILQTKQNQGAIDGRADKNQAFLCMPPLYKRISIMNSWRRKIDSAAFKIKEAQLSNMRVPQCQCRAPFFFFLFK